MFAVQRPRLVKALESRKSFAAFARDDKSFVGFRVVGTFHRIALHIERQGIFVSLEVMEVQREVFFWSTSCTDTLRQIVRPGETLTVPQSPQETQHDDCPVSG